MVGLEVPTDTITGLPIYPRFLLARPRSINTASIAPVVTRKNTHLSRRRLETRQLDVMRWPQWARIALIVGVGVVGLLLIILVAFLCARRRQRAGMTTVSQKDPARQHPDESTSTLEHPVSQVPYGGFDTSEEGRSRHLDQAWPQRRPLGAVASPTPNQMYDVPLQTSNGLGPAEPFASGQHAWRSGPERSMGTTAMAGQGGPPVDSAFSPWNSPTRNKFNKF
ncbi:unnamed protein product [Discula destructiva]